jgi:hypothetical protein
MGVRRKDACALTYKFTSKHCFHALLRHYHSYRGKRRLLDHGRAPFFIVLMRCSQFRVLPSRCSILSVSMRANHLHHGVQER